MTWFDQDSMYRDKTLYTQVVIPVIAFMIVMIAIILVVNNYTNEKIAENKAKSQAELNMINNASCQQLHDKLLSTDHFYDSDNEAIARDHYVAQCGVRLP